MCSIPSDEQIERAMVECHAVWQNSRYFSVTNITQETLLSLSNDAMQYVS